MKPGSLAQLYDIDDKNKLVSIGSLVPGDSWTVLPGTIGLIVKCESKKKWDQKWGHLSKVHVIVDGRPVGWVYEDECVLL